jgi:hypothetical protein
MNDWYKIIPELEIAYKRFSIIQNSNLLYVPRDPFQIFKMISFEDIKNTSRDFF